MLEWVGFSGGGVDLPPPTPLSSSHVGGSTGSWLVGFCVGCLSRHPPLSRSLGKVDPDPTFSFMGRSTRLEVWFLLFFLLSFLAWFSLVQYILKFLHCYQ